MMALRGSFTSMLQGVVDLLGHRETPRLQGPLKRFFCPGQINSTASNGINVQDSPRPGVTLSGFLLGGKDIQIDAWVNSNLADSATLLIGGKYVGVSDDLSSWAP